MAKNVSKTSLWDGLEPKKDESLNTTDVDVYKSNDTHTHKIKEIKDRRVQLLTYGNLIDRMDKYGKQHGMSRAEVFEVAISEFLDRNK